MSFQSILNNVRNYMSQNYILVDEDWLRECVSHFVNENYNENEIKTMTKEQWLLNNITEISTEGCLPPNLGSLKKTVLPNRYVLQINAVVDIGSPAYQQYLKLQKVNTDNLEATTNFEEKVSSHRMLKLSMTDGVQMVNGIEYEPMRNLSIDVTPGSKILIKGPVECRRGTLLLKENSVELLGGEVAELIAQYSQASLLCGILKKEIPQVLSSDTITTTTTTTTTDQQTNNNDPTSGQIMPNDDTHQPMSNFIDDELNFAELDAIEEQYTNMPKRSSNDELVNPVKKLKKSDTDLPCDPYDELIEDEEYLREMEAQFVAQETSLNNSLTSFDMPNNTPSSRSSVLEMPVEPFTYIKHINELDENIGRVFKVKAQILKILSKLTVGKKGWQLSGKIVDGTGTLDVEFSSDVLSKLVGFTPQEMIKMKDQIAKDPEVKERVDSALQKAKENFQTLYCIFELTILENPLVTQLIPFESCHVEDQRKRLHESGL